MRIFYSEAAIERGALLDPSEEWVYSEASVTSYRPGINLHLEEGAEVMSLDLTIEEARRLVKVLTEAIAAREAHPE